MKKSMMFLVLRKSASVQNRLADHEMIEDLVFCIDGDKRFAAVNKIIANKDEDHATKIWACVKIMMIMTVN